MRWFKARNNEDVNFQDFFGKISEFQKTKKLLTIKRKVYKKVFLAFVMIQNESEL